MKKLNLLLYIMMGISVHTNAQSLINTGIGYFGENAIHPGVVLEFEYEKYYTVDFSLPLRADLGFFTAPDYNVLMLDVHKGFRKYLKSGFFFEQSLGVGLTSSFYTVESIFYVDKFENNFRFRDGANLGFTPSVTAGVGYNLTHNKETQNLIWIRPKIYWNFGVRGLNLPYAALQVGYTYNFKTKE